MFEQPMPLTFDILQSMLTFAVIAYLWRKSRRSYAQLRAIRGHVEQPARWATFIDGRGAACPVCGELHPHAVDFGLHGGLGDHIIHAHADTQLAADVRTIRAHSARASMS